MSEMSFSLALEVMYSGRDILTMDNILEVWHTANKLEIGYLLAECEKFLLSILSPENCVMFHWHGKLLDSKRVTDACWAYLLEHFDEVRISGDIMMLTFEEMQRLAQSDGLVTELEDHVVDLIFQWVMHEEDSDSKEEVDKAKPKSVNRNAHLPDLLKASRLCVVSGRCLLNTWCKLAHEQDENIRGLMEESMSYQLMFDRRHDCCSPLALHRKSSSLRNVIVRTGTSDQNALECHLVTETNVTGLGKPSNWSTRFHGNEHICVYEDNIYLAFKEYETTQAIAKYSPHVDGSKWQALPSLSDAKEILSFLSLGPYLFALTRGKALSLCRLSLTASNEWKTFDLSTDLQSVTATTSVGNLIVVFERLPELVRIWCVDTAKRKIFQVPTGTFENTAKFITFRKENAAFALQNNGLLWRLSSCPSHPYLVLEQESQLWDFARDVYGAVLHNGELLLYGPAFTSTGSGDQEVLWEISVPGLFDRVRNVPVYDVSRYAQTVVPKSLLK